MPYALQWITFWFLGMMPHPRFDVIGSILVYSAKLIRYQLNALLKNYLRLCSDWKRLEQAQQCQLRRAATQFNQKSSVEPT